MKFYPYKIGRGAEKGLPMLKGAGGHMQIFDDITN